MTWDAGTQGDFAPQSGAPQLINAGDDRILSAVHRNGSLWFCHTVFLPSGGPVRTAVQWLQVATGGWTIQQLGRVDDPVGSTFFAFPTLAVNAADDALIGLARYTAGDFASGAYVYRNHADAPGQMQQPLLYAPGQNSYFKTFGGNRNRWGTTAARRSTRGTIMASGRSRSTPPRRAIPGRRSGRRCPERRSGTLGDEEEPPR